jgi:hypothetical protein
MLPRHEKLTYALGSPDVFSARALPPFAPIVKAFLARLSERLLADPATRPLSDVVSFAYWCRKANIERQAVEFDAGERLRRGRGVAFHIPPTNVPVNFAFSWVFAMLSGNASILRLPSRDFPQVSLIMRHVGDLLADPEFRELAAMNLFVRYGHEPEINAALSSICDARIIWGGDRVVEEIRKAPMPPRSVDIAFPDRTSLSVLGSASVLEMSDEALGRLVIGFYNDTYLMDQNACSSPRLIVWLGAADAVRAQDRFWAAFEKELARRNYELAAVSTVDKLTQACRDAVELEGATGLKTAENLIYRVGVSVVSRTIENRRCSCGYFYEFATDALDELAEAITWKYQTLTYAGVDKAALARLVAMRRMAGIDRIVPVGAAMEIGLVWDGYDLITALSRICDMR